MQNFRTFEKVYKLFETAFVSTLSELSPQSCVQTALDLQSASKLQVRDHSYDLTSSKIHIIAFGKAVISMAVGAERALGDHIAGGIASVPFGNSLPEKSRIQYYPGAKHNLPDTAAEETTKKIEAYLRALTADDIVVFLISGGGSALLPAPVEGITLEEKLQVIKLLASNGATIQELNTVRIALSRVKGGKLTKLVKGKAIALIISDIIGDPIHLIASGPTVEPREDESALSIVKRLCKENKDISAAVWKALEMPKQQLPLQPKHVQNLIILNNSLFAKILVEHLEKANPQVFDPTIVTTIFDGDATEAGRKFFHQYLNIAKTLDANEEQWKLAIYGGETTVHFPTPSPSNALGGRNQEMALSFFRELIQHQIETFNDPQEINIGIVCLGTDGEDGPTDATGAWCSLDDLKGLSMNELEALKADVESHLKSKSSYTFWSERPKHHIKLGKTGHNLMDIYAIFYRKTI